MYIIYTTRFQMFTVSRERIFIGPIKSKLSTVAVFIKIRQRVIHACTSEIYRIKFFVHEQLPIT